MDLVPIDEREAIPETLPGYEQWRAYSTPVGEWTVRTAKAGAFLMTSVAGGLLFAYVLGAVPNLCAVTLPALPPAIMWAVALAILVAVVVVHEAFRGLIAWWIGADVSFQVGSMGFQTLSRQAIQTRRETVAFYLAPLVVATPLWSVVLIASGYFRAPLVLSAAYFALAANVAGSAVEVYSVWEISRLPRGSLIYNTRHRTLVAYPASSENTF